MRREDVEEGERTAEESGGKEDAPATGHRSQDVMKRGRLSCEFWGRFGGPAGDANGTEARAKGRAAAFDRAVCCPHPGTFRGEGLLSVATTSEAKA